MINSHFIPQLILRHFCEDGKINYFNITNKTVEQRSTKSVFTQKGYYPDQLEKDLCYKIEVQFANILNQKLLCNNHKIVLTRDDMLVFKKFLIITVLRVKDEGMEQNAWYQVLKRDGFIPETSDSFDLLCGDFYDNINKILLCKSLDDLIEVLQHAKNINLFSYITDIIYSYNVFVRTNNCKEDFLISDKGWASYRGPISVKKLNAMYNMLERRYDPFIDTIIHMSSPQDYAVFPLTRNFAVIAMSPAFKMYLSGMPYKIIYPDNAPSLSQCLGFGDSRTIEVPKNKMRRDGVQEYYYEIQQLSKKDVIFLNSLLLKSADKYCGFANKQRVDESLKEYYSAR